MCREQEEVEGYEYIKLLRTYKYRVAVPCAITQGFGEIQIVNHRLSFFVSLFGFCPVACC